MVSARSMNHVLVGKPSIPTTLASSQSTVAQLVAMPAMMSSMLVLMVKSQKLKALLVMKSNRSMKM